MKLSETGLSEYKQQEIQSALKAWRANKMEPNFAMQCIFAEAIWDFLAQDCYYKPSDTPAPAGRAREWRAWHEIAGWIPLDSGLNTGSALRRKQWRTPAGPWVDAEDK